MNVLEGGRRELRRIVPAVIDVLSPYRVKTSRPLKESGK
jgi:hypothetical protein